MTANRRRVDWETFFQVFPEAHGVRLCLPTVDASSPQSVTAEKRIIRIIKARSASEPFALRRLFAKSPTVIECVFKSPAAADDLAREVGASPVDPPPGWASSRQLVADDAALRQLLKMGAASPVAAGEAKERLAGMSLEEQAVALFKAMLADRAAPT